MAAHRLSQLRNAYPNQFWLLLCGNLISSVGMSMIWPFMAIYAGQKLNVPLMAVASLLTINSVAGIASSFAAGAMTDRLGRRPVMVIGMALHGAVYILFPFAGTYLTFALLMALSGFLSPVYRVGVDAMVADLISPQKRIDAYALLRIGNNAGVAIGPSIGGFLATRSYTITFMCTATGLLLYSLLTTLFVKETMPIRAQADDAWARPRRKYRLGGYSAVLGDRLFMAVCTGFTITTTGACLVFVLLSVYAKTHFGVPESQFGFIMATNALMIVLLQVLVTRASKRFQPFWVMAVASLLYSVGIGSIALGTSFPAFLASMVVITGGELLLVATTSAMVADLAPPDMRGRYMSVYGLSWGMASGIAPLFGGFLNDAVGPRAMWVGGSAICLISVGLFVYLALGSRRRPGRPGPSYR